MSCVWHWINAGFIIIFSVFMLLNNSKNRKTRMFFVLFECLASAGIAYIGSVKSTCVLCMGITIAQLLSFAIAIVCLIHLPTAENKFQEEQEKNWVAQQRIEAQHKLMAVKDNADINLVDNKDKDKNQNEISVKEKAKNDSQVKIDIFDNMTKPDAEPEMKTELTMMRKMEEAKNNQQMMYQKIKERDSKKEDKKAVKAEVDKEDQKLYSKIHEEVKEKAETKELEKIKPQGRKITPEEAQEVKENLRKRFNQSSSFQKKISMEVTEMNGKSKGKRGKNKNAKTITSETIELPKVDWEKAEAKIPVVINNQTSADEEKSNTDIIKLLKDDWEAEAKISDAANNKPFVNEEKYKDERMETKDQKLDESLIPDISTEELRKQKEIEQEQKEKAKEVILQAQKALNITDSNGNKSSIINEISNKTSFENSENYDVSILSGIAYIGQLSQIEGEEKIKLINQHDGIILEIPSQREKVYGVSIPYILWTTISERVKKKEKCKGLMVEIDKEKVIIAERMLRALESEETIGGTFAISNIANSQESYMITRSKEDIVIRNSKY